MPKNGTIGNDFGKALTEFNQSSEKARDAVEPIDLLARKVPTF